MQLSLFSSSEEVNVGYLGYGHRFSNRSESGPADTEERCEEARGLSHRQNVS
jgi:hypothetical protein